MLMPSWCLALSGDFTKAIPAGNCHGKLLPRWSALGYMPPTACFTGRQCIIWPTSKELLNETPIFIERLRAPDMDEQITETNPEPKLLGIHWILALPLTGWSLLWLAYNGFNYIRLTRHIFSELKWFSFLLLINPCFWIWLGFFSWSIWAPLYLCMMPWGKYGADLSRKKIVLLTVFVPMLLGLALQYIGPYFYPIGYSETGAQFMRFIPILGGKGYES